MSFVQKMSILMKIIAQLIFIHLKVSIKYILNNEYAFMSEIFM